MNDDELPIRAETASAYLDGELDVDDRARAAADPDTRSLIDSFTTLRAELAAVPPAADSARDAAVMAALAEFDAIHVPAPGAVAATVTGIHRLRLRSYRIVVGFAAAMVLVAVALTAVIASRPANEATSSATEAAPLFQDVDGSAARNAAPEIASTEAADSAGGATFAAPSIDTPEALRQYADTAGTSITASPKADTGPAGTSTPPAPATEMAPACLAPSLVVLGPITVSGAPAYAVRDESSGEVRAIDAVDCHVLFAAP